VSAEPTSTPTKTCPHCGAEGPVGASRCPSCGRRYRRWGRRDVLAGLAIGALVGAIVAVVLLVTGGNGGGESSPKPARGVVTFAQARAIPLRTPKTTVLRRLGQPAPIRGKRGCVYYVVSDQAATAWQFCFVRDVVRSTGTLIRR